MRAALLLATCLLGACANVPPEQRTAGDPWEPYNRSMYNVNTAIDKVTLKPLAKGYKKIVPDPAEKGISNFFSNLSAPRSVVNNFLQGKPGHGFSELGRFLINSTVGIAGIFDVAAAGGIESKTEDFDQTAAVWGVPDGPYVVLPFLGPQTLRGVFMLPLDMLSRPLYHYENTSVRDKLRVLQLIDLRARLLKAEQFLEDSKDPYITLRESYLQNLEFEIHDGAPPEDDEFFDEFLDEDY